MRKKVVHKKSKLKWKEYLPLYLFMLPGLIYLLIYRYLPIGGLVMAFKDFRITRGIMASEWNGLDNFRRLFAVPNFLQILRNTVEISLLKLVFGFTAPIILALMLNELRNVKFKRTLQTCLYLPHFISWVICGTLVFTFFGPSSGVITNIMYEWFGIKINPMMKSGSFRMLLVLSDIWKETGWSSIIYLAALAGIDPTYYEAAMIDGANKWKQLWYITIPGLMPTIMTMFLMRVGRIMNAGMEQIYVLQNPLVYDTSEILDTYIYKVSFKQGQYAIGAAAGILMSVIGLIFVLTTNKIAEKFDQEVL